MNKKRYELSANCTFEANDINNAFLLLAKHFLAMALGEDSSLISEGTVKIYQQSEHTGCEICGKPGGH